MQPVVIQKRVQNLLLVVLTGFAAVALSLAYWGVARAPAILARDDNPRLVEAELRIRRGRILDIQNVLVAETIGTGNTLLRHYPIPEIGPAVGYYSFRHGTAGIEEGLNAILRGDSQSAWEMNQRQILHEAQIGFDVRLTLNAAWQQQATMLMAEHQGALVLLALPDAAIRAMVSLPGYDPNQLDEQFDALMTDEHAPLLNRVTQGEYQPGLVLQPFLFAAALDQGLFQLDDPVSNLTTSVRLDGYTLNCTVPPDTQADYAAALRYGCPAPTQNLSRFWTAPVLHNVLNNFGFFTAPQLPFPIELSSIAPVQNVFQAVIGQENLTVTPLQVALALAALARGGELPVPQLVNAVQDATGTWQPYVIRSQTAGTTVVSAAAASPIIQTFLPQEGIAGQQYTVLSGPEGSTNSWYLGLAPLASPRYVVVVVLENEPNASVAAAIGTSLLETIMIVP